MEKVHWNEQIP